MSDRTEPPAVKIKVLLLAGGLGTRLRPLTAQTPKCLVPLAGRPLLDYWLERLVQAQLQEILINSHHLVGELRQYLQAAQDRWPVRIVEAHEPRLLGSAGTLRANVHWADDAQHVAIIYADHLSDVDLKAMIQEHRQSAAPFTMLLYHSPHPEQFGIAQLDDDGWIVDFQEKPVRPPSDLANGGLYLVTAQTYREMAALPGSDLAYDILPHFVGRMRGWIWDGYHRDIGTLASWQQADRDARHMRLQLKTTG